MTHDSSTLGFTVYLEGHPAHQGNVLARAFLAKTQAILTVLAKMERAFIQSSVRQTDFEITGADKRNPTTLTFRPVAKIRGYNPDPALNWSLSQFAAISHGDLPDERIRGDIARDLVRLASKKAEDGYSAFWINGHSEEVRLDDGFAYRASAFVDTLSHDAHPVCWHTGSSLGSVVGELKAVDDVYEGREFIVVPPTGAAMIACRFPNSLRGEMHRFLFKVVRVEGVLHYAADSPFPYLVDTRDGGISFYPAQPAAAPIEALRGLFSNLERPYPDWSAFLDVR